MARKRFRWVALAAVAAAVGSGNAQGQGTPPAAPATAVPGGVSPRAAIWAATAEYVYQDDPGLDKIESDLLKTIKSNSLQAFNRSVDDAVMLEKKQLPTLKHVLKFQGLVKTVQEESLDPNDPAALAKAIVGKLDDNAERMADQGRAQKLTALNQRLNQLATGAAPVALATTAAPQPAGAGPAVPDPASTDDLTAVETAPETTAVAATQAVAPVALAGGGAPGWVSWLALVLSGLSFGGMMLLFRKQNRPAVMAAPALLPTSPERNASRPSTKKEPTVTWDEMRKFVERQMDERLNTAVAPAATSVAKPAAKPASRASAPALPAAPAPAPVAPEPDDFESFLAPLAAPAPRQYTQYANEAPFNNSFPARALSDQPGTYSMFAIVSSEQQPEQGSFYVTGNLASHVRDHRSVLEPVCEYVGGYPLGSESRVVMVEPGLVRRRGDDWEVVQRAKVRFE